MKKFMVLLLALISCVLFLGIGSCKRAQLRAGTITSCNRDGVQVLNPGCFAGDMGAQLAAAVAACPFNCIIDATPLSGNQTAAATLSITRTNVTIQFGTGSLTFAGGSYLAIRASRVFLKSPNAGLWTFKCNTAAACITLGDPSTNNYSDRLSFITVLPADAAHPPECGIGIENSREGELYGNTVSGFRNGICAGHNAWTWNLAYNKVYSNTEAGVAFIGDEANAFKFTHNLILLNRNGVVFNLDERGGSGVSNGSTFDDQNHCEGNSESCFKFVSGQFYTVHIAATYNELTVPNSSWIKIQNDGVPGHQLILNNLLINASGGYASGGAPIIDVDTSKGYAVPPAHISSIVRDGAGNVTVTTATPHGITCTTASCPYVAVTNAAMPAPMVQIKSVPDPTHLILIWGGPATTSSGGTVTLAHDRANVFLDSMGWRTSSSNQTAIHATGPGAVVRVGPIALFDSLGNFTNAESPSTLKTAEGGTIQVQSFTNH